MNDLPLDVGGQAGSWPRNDASVLELPIPICALVDGRLPIPDFVDHLMFDVGLAFNAPNSIGYLRRNPKSFVIGFEPNPHQYFSYFASSGFAENPWILSNSGRAARIERARRRKNKFLRGTSWAKNTEEFLPKELRSQFLPVPVAITETNYEHRNLFLHTHEGSSSLDPGWNGIGADAKSLPVLGMRLDFFIKLIPNRFSWLSHLKVDAEGLDISVLRSAGQELSRFVYVSVEDGAGVSFLEERGFTYHKRQRSGVTLVNSTFRGNRNEIDIGLRV